MSLLGCSSLCLCAPATVTCLSDPLAAGVSGLSEILAATVLFYLPLQQQWLAAVSCLSNLLAAAVLVYLPRSSD